MHYLINWVLEKSFDLPLLQFVDDIQKNLKKELDFRIEEENSNRGKRNFEQLSTTTIIKKEMSSMYQLSSLSIRLSG
jgi:predicted unusual protein kinase regulating ubiquinone biosynthesis (AarF/ABC1/UbiB family)